LPAVLFILDGGQHRKRLFALIVDGDLVWINFSDGKLPLYSTYWSATFDLKDPMCWAKIRKYVMEYNDGK
jgi:hypothetical protein